MEREKFLDVSWHLIGNIENCDIFNLFFCALSMYRYFIEDLSIKKNSIYAFNYNI